MKTQASIYILILYYLIVSSAFGNSPEYSSDVSSEYTSEDCIACHARQDNSQSRLRISMVDCEQSVHYENDIGCIDCHTNITDETHAVKGADRVDCSYCHDQRDHPGIAALQDFKIATHGKQDFSQRCEKNNCTGCHQGRAAHGEAGNINEQNCNACHLTAEGKPALMKNLLTALDPLFICMAIFSLGFGIIKQRQAFLCGRKVALSINVSGLARYLFSHKKLLGRPSTGASHWALFWGVTIPLVLVIVAQFGLVLPPVPAGILSLVTEIFGLLMVGALIFFLVRQSPLQENMAVMNTFMDTFINKKLPIFLLLFIGLTGFLAEGSRLSIEHSAFSLISPVGCFFSLISPDAPIFLQMMIRIHLMAVLIFLALIPYTFMRHIPAGVQKVLYRDNTLPGQLNPAELDLKPVGAQTALDLSTKGLLDAQACAECGRCEEQCPAFISGKPLSPRKVMQHIYSQAMGPQKAASSQKKGSASLLCDGVGSDEIWSCTTCMACIEHCPVYIRPMDSIMEMRRHLVLDRAAVPKEALSMIRDLEVFEDVSGKGPALKKAWAQAQRIPLLKDLDEKPEVLLWAGCSGMFHPRYADVTLAMAKILTAAGIRFAVLGHGEACCGEPARRLGEEALFNTLAQKNNQALNASGVDTIIVLCPHCFNTLKNEYIIFDQQYEVVPAVSHLLELIEAQKIVPQYPIDKTMALHDPCYLGRANRIFEPLRDLMQALPGITLKELDRSRDKALCCGGGGARMWLHESLGENISTVRARDIDDSRVDTVGTACPFCMTMLQDATVSLSGENAPDVMDIIELTARSIGVENKEIQ